VAALVTTVVGVVLGMLAGFLGRQRHRQGGPYGLG
jgi:ABC-type dipeptide/oligopeptide/nickel transport system permease subunit